MLTLVHGIEALAVAPSPLGDSSQATSPSFRREIRERQGSLAQLEVLWFYEKTVRFSIRLL